MKFNKKISIHKNRETGYIILKQRKAKLLHNTYQSRWSGNIFIIKKKKTNNKINNQQHETEKNQYFNYFITTKPCNSYLIGICFSVLV